MAGAQPKSWAEAMQQYEREKRGGVAPPPIDTEPRYGRTKYCPLGATRRKDYSHPIGDHPNNKADADRFMRHGYGGAYSQPFVCNTVTQRWQDADKEKAALVQDANEWSEGRMKVPGCAPGVGSNRPMPKGRDNPMGRADLFQHLAYAPGEKGDDSWVGNILINPTKGKACDFPPPIASEGRKDLYDILGQTGYRPPEDKSRDAWIGNLKIDPKEGKKNNLPPFMQNGRRDLYDTIQQSGLRHPDDDAMDKWIGHFKINPIEGKAGGLKEEMEGVNDMHEIIRHQSPEHYDRNEPVGVLGFTSGRCGGLGQFPPEQKDFNKFKRTIQMIPREKGEWLYETDHRSKNDAARPVILDGGERRDLFGVINHDPNAVVREVNNIGLTGRRAERAVPGARARNKGADMLYWHDGRNA